MFNTIYLIFFIDYCFMIHISVNQVDLIVITFEVLILSVGIQF